MSCYVHEDSHEQPPGRDPATPLPGEGLAIPGSAGLETVGLVITVANEKTGVKQSVGRIAHEP
jgi:hypothetical protein